MKSNVVVVTDASAAVPPALLEQYGVITVPLHVILDGRDYRETDINLDSFYERLRTRDRLPSTGPASVAEVLDAYEQAAAVGDSIVSIHLTSVFSATYNVAVEAASLFLQRHPGLQIEVIDSYTVESGEGLIAIEAASMAARGASFQEIVAKVYDVRRALCSLYAFETLFFRDKGGRIYKAKPWASEEEQDGPIFKSMIEVDESTKGTVSRVGRARSKHTLLLEAVAMTKGRLAGRALRGAIVHANASRDAAFLRAAIEKEIHCEALYVSAASASTAVQNGEGYVTFAFYPA
ncbi:MAG: DegV family protein [Dehalococcoidia bacterium]|nr:DegV family protein [Dehalococcoidia bacterium]